jgi:hypothetical protein
MDSEGFFKEFRAMVARRSSAESLVDTLAFVSEVSDRLMEDPVFGEFTLVELMGELGTSKYRVHGYTAFDESDGSIGLVVGRWYDGDEIETLTTADVNGLVSGLRVFLSGSIEKNLASKMVASHEAHELSSFLATNIGRIARVRLHVMSNGRLTGRYKEKVVDSVGEIPVELHLWDLFRIQALFASKSVREAVEIDLAEFGSNGIACLPASHARGLESFLCVIDGDLLATLFERFGSRLLEGNVRSFLGMGGGVNRGIRATIRSQPGRFFAYNNGIAATASHVVLTQRFGATYITGLRDLQIVNGGQTTASVLSARKRDGLGLTDVAVPMKLTRVDPDSAFELIPKIAEYANTQNKVSGADFFANHEIHRKLEEISKRLLTPTRAGVRVSSKWFYERSRGQYQNERLYKNARDADIFDREYPKVQLINKTDLAKYDAAWNLRPWIIAKGALRNFLEFAKKFSSPSEEVSDADYWERISPSYGEQYYQNMVSVALIWKAVEKMVSGARDDWYLGDYRAQIVAYTVSKFFHLFKQRNSVFDLDRIWAAQEVSASLLGEIEQIAKIVQREILNLPAGKTNVGEWTKSEACWSQVEGAPLSMSSALEAYAVGMSEARQKGREARKRGELDDEISLQSRLLQHVNDGYFSALRDWKLSNRLFTPGQFNILRKACSVGTYATLTPRDLKILAELVDLAVSEGFTRG